MVPRATDRHRNRPLTPELPLRIEHRTVTGRLHASLILAGVDQAAAEKPFGAAQRIILQGVPREAPGQSFAIGKR